ncbi:MAG: type 4a pilus biogenesis protein PilO [Acidobacteriia bacterium]|nr:type 4a pilus biogenesis protein PilO [Terriglobia bacterium]
MAKSFNDLPAAVQGAILAGVAVVAAGVVFYLYVLPLSAQRDRLDAEVTKLKEENLRNQAVERERTELLNRIAQLETQLATLRSIVPDEAATDQFVRMVYDTSTSAAIHLRTFVAQPPVARDYYIELPFNVRIDGTYYAMRNFFARLSKQDRIVSATNLALGPPPGGGQGTFTIAPNETVGANCVITTYYNRQQPPPKKGPAPKKK